MINWPYNRYSKKNAFVLTSTDHGSMIVNRFDYHVMKDGVCGVGITLLNTSSFDPPEINSIMEILVLLKKTRGDGVVMIDGGANIGVHAITCGRLMQGWGKVIAIEAQERIFYATCGNVALNNLFNVRVLWNALNDQVGVIHIPVPDYFIPSSFGSLELQHNENSEFIGQPILPHNTQPVNAITIDSLELNRVDFIKLDVEAMEEKVLSGSINTISKFKPIIHLEKLKSNATNLVNFMTQYGYIIKELGPNMLCIHESDPVKQYIQQN
jgi:FkbM family methyltransferase